jgi:transposase
MFSMQVVKLPHCKYGFGLLRLRWVAERSFEWMTR